MKPIRIGLSLAALAMLRVIGPSTATAAPLDMVLVTPVVSTETAAQSGVWGELAFGWEGLSVWPSPRRPSLICLEAGLFPGTSAWPLPLDREPFSLAKIENYLTFRPHATVMRFHRRWRKSVGQDWGALRERLPTFEPERIRFDRVSFLLSTLTPEQPVYPREFTAHLR